MRFRTSLLLWILLLIAGTLALMVLAAAKVIERSAVADLTADLERSRAVFEAHLSTRQALYRSSIRLVVEEPRLRAVAATEDISRETVLGVLADMLAAVQADVLLLVDPSGRLIADANDPAAAGFDMQKDPVVAKALEKKEAQGLWADAQSIYQVQARAILFGESSVGVVVLGHRIDDRTAGLLERQTGRPIAVTLDGSIVALSPSLRRGSSADEIARALASGAMDRPEPVEIGGERYLTATGELSGYEGQRRLRYVVLASLDGALAPARSLALVLLGVAAAALLSAFVISLALSRKLSRPVDELVAFVNRVGGGQLEGRIAVSGPHEVRALGAAMNRMVEELATSRAQAAEKQRIEQEMEIAARIQTSILPPHLDVPGLDIAGLMKPASEVGGDYYDVVSTPGGGAWIGIGDVAGHGLSAGLVMMMIQSAVAGLTRQNPAAPPSAVLCLLNEVLYDNVRRRLRHDEHATLSLLRYDGEGRLTFAGAHEDIIVFRAKSGRCEMIETPGTWVGAAPTIDAVTVDTSLTLDPGDVMVLYTDGITEAMDAQKTQFGPERLREVIERCSSERSAHIAERVISAVAEWSSTQADDDRTVLVIRRITGAPA